MAARTIGVEEELLLVDAVTSRPRALAAAVLRQSDSSSEPADGVPGGTLEAELKQEQIEVDTSPCTELADLHLAVIRARQRAKEAASAAGAQVAALALAPTPAESHTTVKPRYLRMAEFFGITEWEYLTCGCHVHVNVDSRDEGIAVIDRIRSWLPVLLAMSANSPFSQGADTRYQSYRSQMAVHWPTAGPTELFGTPGHYDAVVNDLLNSGAAMDRGMIYFDARLSQRYPTVEIRVADVCLEADDTVLIAALVRGLVETASRQAADGVAPDPVRTDLLRGAMWRAGRHGITGELVDPRSHRLAPAPDVIGALIEHVAPALRELGDLDAVRDRAQKLLARGSGATRQRQVFERTRSLTAVIADAVARTV